jgi:multicomponent Na+:H+ antiporter subunit A
VSLGKSLAMLDMSFYLFIGVLLAGILAIRAKWTSVLMIIVYWLVIAAWSIQWISPFSTHTLTWSTVLAIEFSYHIDDLACLFSLLISGIGVLIFIYAVIYTQGYAEQRRKLLSILQLFAVSMLSIVLTDNLLVLFLSWELTSITSYLLIQFNSDKKQANQAAFNSLFITTLGSLAMLTGFVLLQQHTATWSLQESVSQLKLLDEYSASLQAAFYLMLLGAISKSAQFPLHFWLPGAMQAPTPVSAYLHSATMVNAGVYLLARLHPMYSDLPMWYPSLAAFGITTMLVASVVSLLQTDLKAILAYTTLFVLGSMTYLLASQQWLAAEAFVVLLLLHAIYKASLFMLAGVLDKEYGTRDIVQLRGIARGRPGLTVLLIINFSVMAGVPPLIGFVIKEMIYEAKLAAGLTSVSLIAMSFISSILIATVSFKCLYYFFSKRKAAQQTYHTLPFGLLLPSVLSAAIILFSASASLLQTFLASVANDIVIDLPATAVDFYSGLGSLLSMLTVLGGAVILVLGMRLPLQRIAMWLSRWHFHVGFELALQAILYAGRWFTFITQRQSLTCHLQIMFVSLALLLLMCCAPLLNMLQVNYFSYHNFWLSSISVLLISAAASLIYQRALLINMVSFSIIGLAISFLFLVQGAPDVAMTQLLVEILIVVIILVALRNIYIDEISISKKLKAVNAVIAISIGVTLSLLLWLVTEQPLPSDLSVFFLENSMSKAFGNNVVNVILVDFRSLDTLGEAIVILATIVAIGAIVQQRKKT